MVQSIAKMDSGDSDNAMGKLVRGQFNTRNILSPELIRLAEGRKSDLTTMFKGIPQAQKRDSDVIDLSSWIYVLQFPNPDAPECRQRAVTAEEALAIFKESFLPRENKSASEERRNQVEEAEAFMQLFTQLDSYEGGKKWCAGGRLQVQEDGRYTENIAPASDFLTLLRSVAMVKLTQHLCLNARQVLSSNGQSIYVVLYGDEEDYLAEAERTEFNAQLNVASTDGTSLEPCDRLLRPLRLLTMSESTSVLVKEVDLLIQQALPEAGSYYFEEFSGYTSEGVKEGHWVSYESYLAQFRAGIQEMLVTEHSLPRHERECYISKLSLRLIEKVNRERPQFPLANLWHRLGISIPIGAYTDFCRNFDADGKDQFMPLWRTHTTNIPGQRSLFRNSERLQLIFSLVNRQIILHSLLKFQALTDSFPLHNEKELVGLADYQLSNGELLLNTVKRRRQAPLVTEWKFKCWLDCRMPINSIKNYFGAKIALYFAFTAFLILALVPISLFGFALFIVQRTTDIHDMASIVLNAIFCVFIPIWAIVSLEFWRRREATLAFAWGSTDFLQDEVSRPEFTGRPRRSPVTDDLEELFYSPIKRFFIMLFNFLVMVLILLVVIGIVAGLIIMRWKLTDDLLINGFDGAGPLASVLNAIQIQIFNYLYQELAFKLTDWENHRTQSAYEQSFVVKSFLFQFVNSYNALIYIAFIKSRVEGCIVKDDVTGAKVKEIGATCMDELYTQLTSIFLVAYLRNFIELGLPWFLNRRRQKAFRNIHYSSGEADLACRRVENNQYKGTYMTRTVDGTFADMLEICIMFGYFTLFAVAFPLGCLLGMIGFLFELHVDRYKLLWLMRRPQPVGAGDIGVWWGILQITIMVSIFTNAGIFCFTARTFEDHLTDTEFFIPFVIIVVCLLGVRTWLQMLIPDIPRELRIVGQRHDHIRSRYLNSWQPAQKDPAKMQEALCFSVTIPSIST